MINVMQSEFFFQKLRFLIENFFDLPNRTYEEHGINCRALRKKFFSRPEIFYTESGIVYLWMQIDEVINGNKSKKSCFTSSIRCRV